MPAFHCDIAVVLDTCYSDQCQSLAAALQLPLVAASHDEYPFYLKFVEGRLALQQGGSKPPGPIVVDFDSGVANYRRLKGGGELIVKAMGGDKKQRPSVLDATAGLGRDSFVLASWGFPVVMCERNPVIACLLRDGLRHAGASSSDELTSVITRLSLEARDAFGYLSALAAGGDMCPDIVYIDPMFPVSGKSAQVKKEMQAFHQVVGPDSNNEQLLALARQVAVHRVVVKRPKKSPPWLDATPSFSLSGKAVRFDIYAKKAFAKP